MDKSKIKNRFEEAQKLKVREQYATALKDELSKPEWTEELESLIVWNPLVLRRNMKKL